jgi:ferritin-like metal-binding protein YciE
VRELFVDQLRAMLGIEQRLAKDVLPALRERAHAAGLRRALDRHLLETEEHVANLRRVFTLAGEPDVPLEAPPPPPEPVDGGDFAVLLAVLRTEALEVAAYRFLVHTAEALALDGDAAHLLRLNMEQDAYALEEAEKELVQLLAEKAQAPNTPTS